MSTVEVSAEVTGVSRLAKKSLYLRCCYLLNIGSLTSPTNHMCSMRNEGWSAFCWHLRRPMAHAAKHCLAVSSHYDNPLRLGSHHTTTQDSRMDPPFVGDCVTKIGYRTMIHYLAELAVVQMKIRL